MPQRDHFDLLSQKITDILENPTVYSQRLRMLMPEVPKLVWVCETLRCQNGIGGAAQNLIKKLKMLVSTRETDPIPAEPTIKREPLIVE